MNITPSEEPGSSTPDHAPPPFGLMVPDKEEAPEKPAPTPAGQTMRVGEYVVGDAYCDNLYGHPDIRYDQ